MFDKNTFLIGGWLAPENTSKAYELVKECGINTMFLLGSYSGTLGDDLQIDSVKACNEAGVNAIPTVNVNTLDVTDERLKGFNNVPAILIYDEPHIKLIKPLKKAIKQFKDYYDKNTKFIINLLPSYTPLNVLKTTSYEKYLKSMFRLNENSKKRSILSLDFYPLFKRDYGLFLTPMWLPCLSLFADYSLKLNIPLHCFIQTMAFAIGNDVVQSYELLRLQLCVYLSFGFSGFTHFCYASPGVYKEDFFEHQTGIVGRKCEKTPLFDRVKKVNAYVQYFAPYYLSYKYCGTFGLCNCEKYSEAFADWKKTIDINDTVINNIECNDAILVGCFKKGKKKSGFFITNYEFLPNLTSKVKLNFKQKVDIKIHQNNSTLSIKNSDKIDLRLEAGEGVFIEVKNI